MSDSSAFTFAKTLVPKLPTILGTVVAHTLRLYPQYEKWDLRTAVVVSIIRSYLNPGNLTWTLSQQQAFSLRDPGIKLNTWISKTMFDVGEQEARDLRHEVWRAIDAMASGGNGIKEDVMPLVKPVDAEWTGNRRHAELEMAGSEQERYDGIMKEVESDVTILYFHGGAYFLMDPASHRLTARQLCNLTKGRALSVRYRLSPQSPFPAPLLDALAAYLSLLSPSLSSTSYHKPTPASHIVFAGDSAGGGLALCLLQLLLQLNRQGSSVTFNGRTFSPIPLPAGVAPFSPWTDLSQTLPSHTQNLDWDYLPPARDTYLGAPSCDLWPGAGPVFRNSVVTPTVRSLTHPLASPAMCEPGAWQGLGATKVQMICGQETLTDDTAIVARRIARDAGEDGCVRAVVFDGRPHCFAMLDPKGPTGRKAFGMWAGFMAEVVKGESTEEGWRMGGWRVSCAPKLEVEEVRAGDLTELDVEDAKRLAAVRIERLLRLEKEWLDEEERKKGARGLGDKSIKARW